MKLLIDAFFYMQSAPFFWGSVGFTVAIAMFIGAYVYDGNVAEARKGLFSVVSYAAMIFWVTASRVVNTYFQTNGLTHSSRPELAFAGAITIVIVSLAWVLGMSLGVLAFKSREVKK